MSISKEACDKLAPMVLAFYTSITGETAKLKEDKSVFTIADGIVQHLLIQNLFSGGKFANLVGEEDETNVNIETRPFTVDDLVVPDDFCGLIESVREDIKQLASNIDPNAYKSLTVFIDPIDGTREFSTGLGEQCSICIGFSDASGKPVAGIVYRPITQPPTWGGGAVSEGCKVGNLDMAASPNNIGLLTSNGGISPFIGKLIEELAFERVPSGGAGNKMMMLLEGKGVAYIQDRGVSRWDTAAAQAVIEAYGGILVKLSPFISEKKLESYTYLKSSKNLDFVPGEAALTPYNAADKSAVKKGETVLATSVDSVKAYSNLCGLLALDKAGLDRLEDIHAAIQRAKSSSAPTYD